MGEDVTASSKFFELPSDGKVVLPDFETIESEDIPQEVIDQIEFDLNFQEVSTHRRLIRPPLKLEFGQAGQAYLMAYDFKAGIEGLANFRGIFEVDISADGQNMGSGNSLIDLDEAMRERVRPYVGHTYTGEGFTRKGLALRRLFILNEANKKWFGDTLGSGIFVPGDNGVAYAADIWEQLLSQGFAVKEDESYRFK